MPRKTPSPPPPRELTYLQWCYISMVEEMLADLCMTAGSKRMAKQVAPEIVDNFAKNLLLPSVKAIINDYEIAKGGKRATRNQKKR